MAFSKTQKALLRKLANYSWDALPSDCYYLDFDVVETHTDNEVFAKSKQEVVELLTQAGLQEGVDFVFNNAIKFDAKDIRHIAIPYPLLINPELNDFLDDQLLQKARRDRGKS